MWHDYRTPHKPLTLSTLDRMSPPSSLNAESSHLLSLSLRNDGSLSRNASSSAATALARAARPARK